jgi:hypothetical protein
MEGGKQIQLPEWTLWKGKPMMSTVAAAAAAAQGADRLEKVPA